MIKNQLKAGALLSYLVLITGNIIGLLYTPFMLRMLGQSQYGLYSLANNVVGYLTVLDFGFGNATIRYTAKFIAEGSQEKIESLHGTFLFLYGIIGSFVFLASILLSFFSGIIFSKGLTAQEIETIRILFILSGLNIAISFPFGIFGSIITAYERFVFLRVFAFIRLLVNPLVFVPVLLFGYKSIGLIIATTILNFLFFIINCWYCFSKLKIKIPLKKPDFSILKEIFKYSFWVFLASIVTKLWWNSGQFLLGIFSTTVAIAIYSLAIQFKFYYESFAVAISGVFLPKLTAMNTAHVTDKEMTSIFIKVGRLQYIILSLIFTGFFLFGKTFIILWAGNDYINTYYITLMLFLPLALIDTQTIGITILQAKNKHAFRSIVYLGIAVICCTLSIPLIKKYGAFGCAIGTSSALIIGNIFIMNWYYYRKAGLNIFRFWLELLKMTPGILLPTFLMWFMLKNYAIPNFINLFIFICLYTLIYFLSMYFLSFNKYEKKLIYFWRRNQEA